MRIFRKNGFTLYLDLDEETMDRFDDVAQDCHGFLATDARVARAQAEAKSQKSAESPEPDGGTAAEPE